MDNNRAEDRPSGLPQILFQVEPGPSITVTFAQADLNCILHSEETMDQRLERVTAGQPLDKASGSGQQASPDQPRPVLALHQSDVDLVTLVKTFRDGIPGTVKGRLHAAQEVNRTHQMIGSNYLQQKREDLLPTAILKDIREKIFVVEKEATEPSQDSVNPEAIAIPDLEALSVRNKSLPGFCIFPEKRLTEVQAQINQLVEDFKKVAQKKEEAVITLRNFAQESKKVADRYNTVYSIAEEVYGELIETVVALRSFILNRREYIPTAKGSKVLTDLADCLERINGLGINEVVRVLRDLEDDQESDQRVTRSRAKTLSKSDKSNTKSGLLSIPGLRLLSPEIPILRLDLDIEEANIPDNIIQDIMSKSLRDESPVKKTPARVAKLKVEPPEEEDETNGVVSGPDDTEEDNKRLAPKGTPAKKGPSPGSLKGKESKKEQNGKQINSIESGSKKRRVRNRKMDHFYKISMSTDRQLVTKINTYAGWLV